MRCPVCSSDNLSVAETRPDGTSIRRRRVCQDCDNRFSTYERVERALPIIVKKDGRRQSFNPNKIRQGLIRACQKRPVTLEAIDNTVSDIERQVVELASKEVGSNKLGEIVIAALRELDSIAYIRFQYVVFFGSSCFEVQSLMLFIRFVRYFYY